MIRISGTIHNFELVRLFSKEQSKGFMDKHQAQRFGKRISTFQKHNRRKHVGIGIRRKSLAHTPLVSPRYRRYFRYLSYLVVFRNNNNKSNSLARSGLSAPEAKTTFLPASLPSREASARSYFPAFSSLCRLLSEQVGLLAETVRPFFTWFFLRHLAKATVFVVLL